MRIIGAMRSSLFGQCSKTLTVSNITVIESRVSIKSMIRSTISRGKVFIRLLINRRAGNYINGSESLPAELSTRITLSKLSANNTKPSNHKWINSLLNGERVIINRIISKWYNNSIVKRNDLFRGTALSLGLIGVCVKRDSATLITETDQLECDCQEIRSIFDCYRQLEFTSNKIDTKRISLSNLVFGSCIGKGCNGVVYKASLKDGQTEELAIKMLFNYEAESNAAAIWRAMHKECLPFNGDFSQLNINDFLGTKEQPKLRSHPNIVEIHGVFADLMPTLKDSYTLYPDALPSRLGGYARNMTLFIVEKRYDMSLKQYLSQNNLPNNESLIILTQLLEAVSYLVKCQIAHRDIKTDNVLLDLSSYDMPWLVITDFGFCITDLSLSFTSDEVCRGGNRALMAPEIICAKAGSFSRLDYSNADLWSVGTIAYELFGGLNPFYPYPQRNTYLQSYSYKPEELPEMPDSVPQIIKLLVNAILERNPNKRPSALTALTISQMALFMSERFLQKLIDLNSKINRENLLIHWLKMFSLNTLVKRKTILNREILTDVEFKLRVLMLSRVKLLHLMDAIDYISNSRLILSTDSKP